MADSDDGRSFYALLGVSPTATEDEIRRAYRQLATALHPDKVRNAAQHDEASELFTRIQEAYEVRGRLASAWGVRTCFLLLRKGMQQHWGFALRINRAPAQLKQHHRLPRALAQVLSDPQKRDIYDVYGKEGLAAGLQVGNTVGRWPLPLTRRGSVACCLPTPSIPAALEHATGPTRQPRLHDPLDDAACLPAWLTASPGDPSGGGSCADEGGAAG